MAEVTLTDAADRTRFEARVGDELVGWLDYTDAGRRVVLRHTEVLPGHEGEGIGGSLVRAVLDRIRAQPEPQEVIPICPFVAQWLMRHRDYAPLVTPALRGQFEPRPSD